MQDFLKINEKDNVAVALRDVAAGTGYQDSAEALEAQEDIPAGHKMALCAIPRGGQVVKYGYPIGIAKEDIRAGDWVHTHNIRTGLGELLEYSYRPHEAAVLEKPEKIGACMGHEGALESGNGRPEKKASWGGAALSGEDSFRRVDF